MTPLFAELNLGEHRDVVVWFAHPKQTSKDYTADIHRDRGWDTLAARGLASVRQVAIDDDWSALRFRRLEFAERGGRR